MSKLIALTSTKRRRGNPKLALPIPPTPALLTEFEVQVERLGLSKAEYVNSAKLRDWCRQNRNRCYVPEWLLKAWGLSVDSIFSGVA
jgi:hypothetical protein